MEYVNLVNQIIAAEHSAKELGQEVKVKQDALQSDLVKESTQLREDYFARADHRIHLVEETERAAAQEQISRLDKKLKDGLEDVENAYRKNRDTWVDTLFQRIVNGNA